MDSKNQASPMPTDNNSEKPRRCCLKQRALVYDTTSNSCTIKTDEEIKEITIADKDVLLDHEDYLSFHLGPPSTDPDSWDLYVNENEDQAIAVGGAVPPHDAIFVAGLRLNNLGVWGRFLRRTGALNNGYIIKPQTTPQETPQQKGQ
ncbi:hypothetical protein F5Y12DRAFT_795598 [Xylaria sp. FL1777]|nr:hypothetical protein F5Y12DRAFT_795598 [Xylaria sp. FL1777]